MRSIVAAALASLLLVGGATLAQENKSTEGPPRGDGKPQSGSGDEDSAPPPPPRRQREEDAEARYPIEGRAYGGVFRSGPGTNYRRIGSVAENDDITILRRLDVVFEEYNWFEIRWRGRQGYFWGANFCVYGQKIPGAGDQC